MTDERVDGSLSDPERNLLPGSALTRREREILPLLTKRLTDLEIAEQLFISPRTTSTHVGRILAKLGAANRRQAAAVAMNAALV